MPSAAVRDEEGQEDFRMSWGFGKSADGADRSDALRSNPASVARTKCLRCLLGGAATLTLGLFAVAPAAVHAPQPRGEVAAAPAAAIEDVPSLPDLPPADVIAPEVIASETTPTPTADESPPPEPTPSGRGPGS